MWKGISVALSESDISEVNILLALQVVNILENTIGKEIGQV